MKVFFFALLFVLFSTTNLFGQLGCANENFDMLRKLNGAWKVSATDRTSPGKYEENEGSSKITSLFDTCSIEEKYEGTFKNKPFHFKTILALTGGDNIEKLWLDSGHGGMMLLAGKLTETGFETVWSRKLKTRTLMIKHVYKNISARGFLTESYLSPDSGKEWQLTHRWKYTRK